MTARLSRRLVVGATSAALLGGALGVVPLLSPASAACTPTYTDAAGDAALLDPTAPEILGNDANLDLLEITHTVDSSVFRSVVRVAGLEDFGPAVGFVDEFSTSFTVNAKAVTITAQRDHTTDPETDTGTLTVAGTDTTVPVKVLVDLTAETVTTEIAASAFDTAVGGATGKPFTDMKAASTQVIGPPVSGAPGLAHTQDEAAAPAGRTYTFGTSCSGGVTPGPTGSATASPTASPRPTPAPTKAPDGTFLQPRKNCAQLTDPTGDADPTMIGLLNEGSLDLTQLNLKSPAGQLQVFVKVAAADEELAPLWSGRVYETSFTVNAKKVVLQTSADGPATATVGGAANSDIKATTKIDTAASNVVFTIPLDGLNKAVGTTIKAGTPVTDPAAATYAQSELGDQAADDAAGSTAAQKSYRYGDNSCFLPAPGKLTLSVDRGGQYGDLTVFYATMKDVDNAPLVRARLYAVLTGGRMVSALTDTSGTATFRLPILVPAGAKTLTVAYVGNDEVAQTVARKAFSVAHERTVLRARSISRGVQVTLLDDDRPARPVVSRVVVLTVGSKKHSLRTNSAGVVRLAGLKRGTLVRIAFPGVRGYYTSAKTITARAG